MIAAYREPDRSKGREQMTKLIESISHGVPKHSLRSLRSAGH
jgi:hypothetical protein